MTKYLETKTNSIEEAIKSVVLGEAMSGEDVAKRMMKIKTMKSFANKVAKMKTVSRGDLEKILPDYISGGDITKVIKEKLDPVNKVAVKKKFDDRKDKDIDNDGDVDSTDKYLHKRRKAISKAIKSERVTDVGVDQAKRDLKHAKLKKATDDVKKEEVELDEKFTKKDFAKNEADNQHTENGVELVKMFGTPEEKRIMTKIAKNHEKRGSIIPNEQFLRDRLVKKYYPKLKEEVEIDEGYESEVMKVLNKADIDGYFKMGKLHVNKRDAKDAKKALEDSDEITKLPKMVMEDNKMMKLTKRQRQALSSPAAKGKGKSGITLPGAEFLSKKKQPMKVGRQSQVVKYEAYDIGNDYAKHTLRVTPGQGEKDVDEMLGIAQKKNVGMREALAKVWGLGEGKNPFEKNEKNPLTKEEKHGKTMTGQKPTKVEVEPKMEKK